MKLEIDGHKIAYEYIAGRGPCVIFCPGFNSTMQGNKAHALRTLCLEQGLAFIRFDYSGHGDSDGDFADGCISSWLNDTLALIDRVAPAEVVLVGSSMGGWIALLAAIRRRKRVRGLLLIACAVDMTKFYPKRLAGIERQYDDQGRAFYSVENEYDDQQPYSIYQKLIDDGTKHYLLDGSIDLDIPIRLLHGIQDEVVEWQRSKALKACLVSPSVTLATTKEGDHRLSMPHDLAIMRVLLLNLLSEI